MEWVQIRVLPYLRQEYRMIKTIYVNSLILKMMDLW